ncbi:MAG: V-type proton ATPase subunit E [Chlamydiales bacterium]|nr:V-type proton ATPase subunit E [Chlamydiales bacterium]
MESLETGKDKIKKICDILKNETLQPAKEEAQQIIEAAGEEAHQIIRDAEAKAEELFSAAKAKVAKERELFEGSMKQACRQGVEALKQEIENKLFNDELVEWLEKNAADPQTSSKLISALTQAIEKEGISADFSALIPKQVPAEQVNALLAKEIVERLRAQTVEVGDFGGGVQLKLHDRKLTLDLSDRALKELLGQYIRKDFRELLFQS